MLKKSFLLMIICLTLFSCATTHTTKIKNSFVWDEELSAEETTSVVLYYDPWKGSTIVTSYNGISVDWRSTTELVLPAGPTTFTVTGFYHGYSNYDYTLRNYIVEFNFKAGKHYELGVMHQTGPFALGFFILDKETQEKIFFPIDLD